MNLRLMVSDAAAWLLRNTNFRGGSDCFERGVGLGARLTQLGCRCTYLDVYLGRHHYRLCVDASRCKDQTWVPAAAAAKVVAPVLAILLGLS